LTNIAVASFNWLAIGNSNSPNAFRNPTVNERANQSNVLWPQRACASSDYASISSADFMRVSMRHNINITMQ